jgi:hypothetical protein
MTTAKTHSPKYIEWDGCSCGWSSVPGAAVISMRRALGISASTLYVSGSVVQQSGKPDAKVIFSSSVAMGFVEVAVLATCAFCLVVVGHVTASQTTIDPKIGPQIGDEPGAQLMT